jgi:hypothetical protein
MYSRSKEHRLRVVEEAAAVDVAAGRRRGPVGGVAAVGRHHCPAVAAGARQLRPLQRVRPQYGAKR